MRLLPPAFFFLLFPALPVDPESSFVSLPGPEYVGVGAIEGVVLDGVGESYGDKLRQLSVGSRKQSG